MSPYLEYAGIFLLGIHKKALYVPEAIHDDNDWKLDYHLRTQKRSWIFLVCKVIESRVQSGYGGLLSIDLQVNK